MQGSGFGCHLRQHVAEFGAVGNFIDEGRVFLAHGLPISAVHIDVPKVVAMHAPRIGECLLPFGTRVEREGPVFKIQRKLRQFGGRFWRGFYYPKIIQAPEQYFLSVSRNCIAAHIV